MTRRPANRRRSAKIRIALRRMSAITVFVAALALTSPPAAAPTDREPPALLPMAAFHSDPLLGPWSVEQLLTPDAEAWITRDAHHDNKPLTPAAAVTPAAGVRAMWLVRRVRLVTSTVRELLRQGSATIRIGLRWVRRLSWPADLIHQAPLPTPVRAVKDLPVIPSGGFNDILHYGGTGSLRSGLQMPVAATAWTTQRPRHRPYRLVELWGQGSPESCF